MASFMFDEYIKSVGHNTTNIPVPITETSGVGFCLIVSGETELKKTDSFGAVPDSEGNTNDTITERIAIDETDGAKAIIPLNTSETHIHFKDIPTEYDDEVDITTNGYTMIKAHSAKFGKNPSVTTIKDVIGAVMFAYSGSDVPSTLTGNAIPVCYVDFNGTVNSSAGPFKVVFKNGTPDQEDDPATVPDSYGTIFIMK